MRAHRYLDSYTNGSFQGLILSSNTSAIDEEGFHLRYCTVQVTTHPKP